MFATPAVANLSTKKGRTDVDILTISASSFFVGALATRVFDTWVDVQEKKSRVYIELTYATGKVQKAYLENEDGET